MLGSLFTFAAAVLASVFGLIYLVRTRTRGRPPIMPVFIILILLLTGFFFNIL